MLGLMSAADSIDPRPVHIKLAPVNGRTYFISVLPPASAYRDETVWRYRNPTAYASRNQYADTALDTNLMDRL